MHSKLYLTEIGRARVGKMVESARADLATRSMQRLDKICMFRAQEGGDNDAALR